MRVVQKMKNAPVPVQEQKTRTGTAALCCSLFGDQEGEGPVLDKGERRLISRIFFDDYYKYSRVEKVSYIESLSEQIIKMLSKSITHTYGRITKPISWHN